MMSVRTGFVSAMALSGLLAWFPTPAAAQDPRQPAASPVLIDKLGAYTAGAVRDVAATRLFELGVGGDVTFYSVPSRLQSFYGTHPVSLHVFAHVRPGGSHIVRMWNMTMTGPAHDGR